MKHFLLLFFIIISTALTLASDDGELIFVHILYRHGARTALNRYATDPYTLESWNGTGWGQLTDKGKQQQYHLGKWLRKRYDKLLTQKYDQSLIHVQSTDVDRTLMSAYSNLAGLYRAHSDNWSPDIKWQPIPVHTIPEDMDNVLAGKKPCRKFERLLNEFKNSPEMVEVNENYEGVYKYASKHSGENIKDINDLETLYNVLLVEDENNFVLPLWTPYIYPQPMKILSDFTYRMPCYTPELARLKSGKLIGEMLQHFNDKIDGTITENVWVYSGHDSTIANLLQALGIFNGIQPPYCATVMVELHKKSSDYFVSFLYMNSTNADTEPMTLHIPDCERLCPLTKLSKLIKPIIPNDWDRECMH